MEVREQIHASASLQGARDIHSLGYWPLLTCVPDTVAERMITASAGNHSWVVHFIVGWMLHWLVLHNKRGAFGNDIKVCLVFVSSILLFWWEALGTITWSVIYADMDLIVSLECELPLREWTKNVYQASSSAHSVISVIIHIRRLKHVIT